MNAIFSSLLRKEDLLCTSCVKNVAKAEARVLDSQRRNVLGRLHTLCSNIPDAKFFLWRTSRIVSLNVSVCW